MESFRARRSNHEPNFWLPVDNELKVFDFCNTLMSIFVATTTRWWSPASSPGPTNDKSVLSGMEEVNASVLLFSHNRSKNESSDSWDFSGRIAQKTQFFFFLRCVTVKSLAKKYEFLQLRRKNVVQLYNWLLVFMWRTVLRFSPAKFFLLFLTWNLSKIKFLKRI